MNDMQSLTRFLRHFMRLLVAQFVLLMCLAGSVVALWQIGTPDQARISQLAHDLAAYRGASYSALTTLQGTSAGNHNETRARLKDLQAGERRIEAEMKALERQKGPTP